jgi:hypothetical protein
LSKNSNTGALNFFKTNYLDAMSDGPHMVFKKPSYPISSQLKAYLDRYKRSTEVPVHYEDLLRFSGSVSVYGQQDDDTLWVRVFYSDEERKEIDVALKKIYSILHSDGSDSIFEDLSVDAIDYCTFGNSKPFDTETNPAPTVEKCQNNMVSLSGRLTSMGLVNRRKRTHNEIVENMYQIK